MLGRAHRKAVRLGAEAFGLVEAELRARSVDQEVVPDLLGGGTFAGRLDYDIGRRVAGVTFGVELAGRRPHELDPVALVHRRQGELDLGLCHQADADPDVGRDPVVGLVGRYDCHRVAAAEPLPGERCRRVAGDAGTQHDNPAHATPPVSWTGPRGEPSPPIFGAVPERAMAAPRYRYPMGYHSAAVRSVPRGGPPRLRPPSGL